MDKQYTYTNACSVGDVDLVLKMINEENKKFKTPKLLSKCLVKACQAGHIEIINALFQYMSTSLCNKIISIDSKYLLYKACTSGNFEIINKISTLMSHNIKKMDYLWHYGLYGITESGKIEIFKHYMDRPGNTFTYKDDDVYLASACNSGSIDLINFILDNYKDKKRNPRWNQDWNWDKGLGGACRGGNMEIVEYMISKGATDWDKGLKGACMGGHIEMVEYMISKGATNWNKGLRGACEGGHFEIAKLMFDKGGNTMSINRPLYFACVCKYTSIVELILQYIDTNNIGGITGIGVNNANEGLKYACVGDDCTRLINLFISRGANDWNSGLIIACQHGNIEIVRTMLEHGATNFNEGIVQNIKYNTDSDIINLLINKGADNFSCLADADDFKLYTIYTMYAKLNKDNLIGDIKYSQLLQEYPPYILFVGSRCSKIKYCWLQKLPVKLFILLFKY